MTIWDDMLSDIYSSPIAVPGAVFDGVPGQTFTIVDKTAGVELVVAKVRTVAAALCIRNTELVAKGVTDVSVLVNNMVTFNGNTWKVVTYQARPLPSGENSGEYLLLVRKVVS